MLRPSPGLIHRACHGVLLLSINGCWRFPDSMSAFHVHVHVTIHSMSYTTHPSIFMVPYLLIDLALSSCSSVLHITATCPHCRVRHTRAILTLLSSVLVLLFTFVHFPEPPRSTHVVCSGSCLCPRLPFWSDHPDGNAPRTSHHSCNEKMSTTIVQ